MDENELLKALILCSNAMQSNEPQQCGGCKMYRPFIGVPFVEYIDGIIKIAKRDIENK